MIGSNEEVLKKDGFEGIEYSSAKRYSCKEGELTLTSKHLRISCGEKWSKTLQNEEIRLEAYGKTLKVYTRWYSRLLFKITISEAKEWQETFRQIETKRINKYMVEFWAIQKKIPEEWERLFDINPQTLRKIYIEIGKENTRFRIRNVGFNLDIQNMIQALKNRKLKAFIIAHNYVAWYEWTKAILNKIYKAKHKKGPKSDEELIEFLDEYPSLSVLNTERWEIEANQIRNCVAHEKFYYDYRTSELVLMVGRKEKRIRLRELEHKCMFMSSTYLKLLQYLKDKVTKGEISVTTYRF